MWRKMPSKLKKILWGKLVYMCTKFGDFFHKMHSWFGMLLHYSNFLSTLQCVSNQQSIQIHAKTLVKYSHLSSTASKLYL